MFKNIKRVLPLSTLLLGSISFSVSADIINVSGTAEIYSVKDRNKNVLEWSEGIYAKGMLMTFSMRIDTDEIGNIQYYNQNTNEVIFARDAEPPYEDWPTRVKGSNYGNDARPTTYKESFSSMVVTLPEVIEGDVTYPAKTFSHKPISNPIAFKLGEDFKKEANYGSASYDKIYITHYDLIEYAEDGGPYIEHNHTLNVSESSVDAFLSGNIMEYFSYQDGSGTSLSSFSTKQKNVDVHTAEDLTIKFKVRSLNWEPVQSCN